jgi:hypothetical protein
MSWLMSFACLRLIFDEKNLLHCSGQGCHSSKMVAPMAIASPSQLHQQYFSLACIGSGCLQLLLPCMAYAQGQLIYFLFIFIF